MQQHLASSSQSDYNVDIDLLMQEQCRINPENSANQSIDEGRATLMTRLEE